MKIDNHLPSIKSYKLFTFVSIVLMSLGTILVYTEEGVSITFLIHTSFVLALSILFYLYPKNKSTRVKISINILMPLYFYFMFIVYPFTLSPLLIICFIPGIAILFYNVKLFYVSLISNVLIMLAFMGYVYWLDQGSFYPLFYADIFGYAINFMAMQIMLFFIFHLFKRKIEEQKLYYEQIQEDERSKTTGQLAAAVAHEIRNPITVVKGFLQLHQDNPQVPEDVRKHNALMLQELHTAETVISDFLSLSKPSKPSSELVDVRDALYNVMDLLNTYALMDTIHIILDIEDDYQIKCSLMEFKQLFVNLIKNAIEASNNGGTIRVKVMQMKLHVVIHVVDQGVGMTKDQLERIGTPFYSLKTKGTGLGLMICFNIVKKYGGTIDIFSKENNGTDVKVTFPIAK